MSAEFSNKADNESFKNSGDIVGSFMGSGADRSVPNRPKVRGIKGADTGKVNM